MISCLFGLVLSSVTLECIDWYPGYERIDAIAEQVHVLDGDTIVYSDTLRIRLIGFDTPELSGLCVQETKMAKEAKWRLTQLVASGAALSFVTTNETDKYGRLLSHLLVDGRDVGEILISENLARSYSGGKRGSWC